MGKAEGEEVGAGVGQVGVTSTSDSCVVTVERKPVVSASNMVTEGVAAGGEVHTIVPTPESLFFFTLESVQSSPGTLPASA